MTILDAAKKLVAHGFSPIPVESGSKKPKIAWKEFQVRRMSASELNQHFSNGARLGIACGEASGNLEVLDFDAPGFFEKWESSLPQGILDKCMVLSTPSGCKHVYYRLADTPQGNQVLARTSDREIAIETRGHGGYVVSYPSEGYAVLRGNYKALQAISDDERETMFAVAYSLNEYYEPPRSYNPGVQRPGDAFNEKASWNELLEEEGWTHVGHSRGNDQWCRPGKTEGTSATCNGEYLYVFTSNAPPLTPGKAYKKFDFLVATDYNGDYFAAAQALGKQGYGSRPQRNYDNAVLAASETPISWVSYDSLDDEDAEYLIEPYFPLKNVTLLFGDSQKGKSTGLYSIAAGLTRGVNAITGGKMNVGRVLILNSEDHNAIIIKKRLQLFNADLSKVFCPDLRSEDGLDQHYAITEARAREIVDAARQCSAKLIIVDPLAGFQPFDDLNKGYAARVYMARLNQIAVLADVAVVAVHHISKDRHASGNDKASASKELTNMPRSVIMAGAVDGMQDHFAWVHTKASGGVPGESLMYTIRKGDDPFFTWVGPCEVSASEIQAQNQPEEAVSKSKLIECVDWLRRTLHEIGEAPSNDIIKGGQAEGYSTTTIYRAKKELGSECKAIHVHKEPGKTGGYWVWKFQDQDYSRWGR